MSYIRFNFFPLTLQVNWGMDLVLPKNYGYDEKLPMVYLLHDDQENYTSWFRNIGLERLADKYHVAIALVDTAQGLYTNMKDGYPFYSFVAEEAPSLLHKNFNPLTECFGKTILVGKGIGAYGAAKWALRAPEAPAGVVAVNPILQIENWYKEIAEKEPERLYRLINAWGEDAAYAPEENHLDKIVHTGDKIPFAVFKGKDHSCTCDDAFHEAIHKVLAFDPHPTDEEDSWKLAEAAIEYGIQTYLK